MIQETKTYQCRKCGSKNIVKNGSNQCGNQQYHCKDCGAYGVLNPKHIYSQVDKAMIMRAYRERTSIHGLERIFYVARQTVGRWIPEIIHNTYLVTTTGSGA